jgi:hypothetical protein
VAATDDELDADRTHQGNQDDREWRPPQRAPPSSASGMSPVSDVRGPH